jgi:hypothetical protein
VQTERTEIRVAYDDEYLYAAGWVYDSRLGEIRVNSFYRDRYRLGVNLRLRYNFREAQRSVAGLR